MRTVFHLRRIGLPALFLSGAVFGTVVTALAQQQIHMENALRALGTARYELSVASPDKGGHRLKAINYVNSAITEVRYGIHHANTH